MFTYLCKPYRAFSFVCAASILTSTFSIGSANAEVPASNLASVESSAIAKSEEMTLSDASIDLDVYRQHVKTLASDEFEGRGPLSKGEEKTVDYLVTQYKKLGLKPAFGDSYTQAVPLAKITPKNISNLKIGGLDFSAGSEFTARTQRIVNDCSLTNSDVIFVGYGINAPEYNWNDYAGLDIKGKTVVMLVNDPGFASKDPNLFQGNAMTYYGRWTYKYEEAARQGAEAVFIIHETMPAGYGWGVVENSNSNTKFSLVDDNNNASQVGVMGWLHLHAARQLFEKAGLDYGELKNKASKPGFTPIALNTKASLSFTNTIERAESQNVAGILEGTDKPEEWVMLHAHWDHLGKVEKNGQTTIYNGAVDNASGVAGVLTLADALSKREEGFARTLMFSAFTAEETGLLGADYFANNPPVPTSNMVAFLNIDGMNVNDGVDYILQYGEGYLSIEDDLATAAALQGRNVKMDPRPQNGLFFRSDHFALAKQGVPSILFMSLGDTDPSFIAKRYHKADDDYLPSWTLGGVQQDLSLIGSMLNYYAQGDVWPYWKRDSDFKGKRTQAMEVKEAK
jgi:Zn-dependent M28 family amino/carboxypeptidase